MMSGMKKYAALLLAISTSLLLTGCIELDSVLTLNKDGSGTIEETTLLSAQASAMMAMMATAGPGQPGGGAPAPPPDLMVSREKAEATAKDMGPGVTLKTFEALKTPDGKQGQKIVYAFPDISKINYHSGNSAATFTFSNGTLTIKNLSSAANSATAPTLPGAPATPGRGANTPPPSDQEIQMVKGMFAGMRMALKVTAPSGIASTDATYVDGNTVTLLDLQMDKLFDNPDALAKISTLSPNPNMSPADAAEVLKGIPGVRAELRDVVTIKLK
jgi:hypothetical protein